MAELFTAASRLRSILPALRSLRQVKTAASGARPSPLQLPIQACTRRMFSTVPPATPVKEAAAAAGAAGSMGYGLLVLPAVAFGLGVWQIYRLDWKKAIIASLEARLNATPVDLPDKPEELADMEYKPVKLRGHFLHDQELYMGPRTLMREMFDGQPSESGFQVITPFILEGSGKTILVNRGWVPQVKKDPRSREKGQLSGVHELKGIVRLTRPKGQFVPDNEPHNNQWYWMDVEAMAKEVGALPILVDLKKECTPQSGLPVAGQTLVTVRNEHMQYAITWFSLGLFTMFLWYSQIYKKRGFQAPVPRRMPGGGEGPRRR
eukprot:m.94587 g.94587  ORF g.94587 m.94587 type:complete len:320 (-) comp15415_c0_seq3:617-1576(-)